MLQKSKKSDRPASSPSNDFSFIGDIYLRKKIEESILAAAGLYLLQQDSRTAAALSKELRRTIILYSASIIESILLYVYKKKKFSNKKIEYMNITQLPNDFQLEKDSILVVAKQVRKEREDRELMLDVLIKVFSEKGIISHSLKKKVEDIKDVRNTFHLSKSRRNIICSPRLVSMANDAIIETIIEIKNFLKI